MNEWINNNTPVDAVFLVSPENQSFLCEAKRSMIIGYKAVIHEPFFLIPWAENYQRIYRFKVDTKSEQMPAAQAYFSYLKNYFRPLPTEKLDYRIDDLSTCNYADSLGPVIHQQGTLVLTKVN